MSSKRIDNEIISVFRASCTCMLLVHLPRIHGECGSEPRKEKIEDSPRRGGLHCHSESACRGTEASPKHKINKVFFDISIYVYLQ